MYSTVLPCVYEAADEVRLAPFEDDNEIKGKKARFQCVSYIGNRWYSHRT